MPARTIALSAHRDCKRQESRELRANLSQFSKTKLLECSVRFRLTDCATNFSNYFWPVATEATAKLAEQ
jgi:hypothetical protein